VAARWPSGGPGVADARSFVQWPGLVVTETGLGRAVAVVGVVGRQVTPWVHHALVPAHVARRQVAGRVGSLVLQVLLLLLL